MHLFIHRNVEKFLVEIFRWVVLISQRSSYWWLHHGNICFRRPATRTSSEHWYIYTHHECERIFTPRDFNILGNLLYIPLIDHRWIEGDATDLPFPDCYFDAITMGYGLRNVVDKRKAVQEMFRVLKPGPIFFSLVWKITKCGISHPWVDTQVLKHQCLILIKALNHLLLHFRYSFAKWNKCFSFRYLMFVDVMCLLDSQEWNSILNNKCFCIM